MTKDFGVVDKGDTVIIRQYEKIYSKVDFDKRTLQSIEIPKGFSLNAVIDKLKKLKISNIGSCISNCC